MGMPPKIRGRDPSSISVAPLDQPGCRCAGRAVRQPGAAGAVGDTDTVLSGKGRIEFAGNPGKTERTTSSLRTWGGTTDEISDYFVGGPGRSALGRPWGRSGSGAYGGGIGSGDPASSPWGRGARSRRASTPGRSRAPSVGPGGKPLAFLAPGERPVRRSDSLGGIRRGLRPAPVPPETFRCMEPTEHLQNGPVTGGHRRLPTFPVLRTSDITRRSGQPEEVGPYVHRPLRRHDSGSDSRPGSGVRTNPPKSGASATAKHPRRSAIRATGVMRDEAVRRPNPVLGLRPAPI